MQPHLLINLSSFSLTTFAYARDLGSLDSANPLCHNLARPNAGTYFR